jgi:hypothetical protein
MKQFIGGKRIKLIEDTLEKTQGGYEIVKVTFEDNTIEHFSKVMFNKIVSDKACDASELRDKRIQPVVEIILAILRDWGIRTGELPYFSALLNQSLDYNSQQALIKLVSQWMPKPNSLDDVDFITIDRILKSTEK